MVLGAACGFDEVSLDGGVGLVLAHLVVVLGQSALDVEDCRDDGATRMAAQVFECDLELELECPSGCRVSVNAVAMKLAELGPHVVDHAVVGACYVWSDRDAVKELVEARVNYRGCFREPRQPARCTPRACALLGVA